MASDISCLFPYEVGQGGGWPGDPVSPTFPQQRVMDYVSAYRVP